jgi:hypothetical protein
MIVDNDLGMGTFVHIGREDRAPEPADGPVYACGEYDADGNLFRATKRYPLQEWTPTAQSVAENVLGAIRNGSRHTVLVWEDESVVPAERLDGNTVPAQGRAGGTA